MEIGQLNNSTYLVCKRPLQETGRGANLAVGVRFSSIGTLEGDRRGKRVIGDSPLQLHQRLFAQFPGATEELLHLKLSTTKVLRLGLPKTVSHTTWRGRKECAAEVGGRKKRIPL